jgi:hypothetical protein
MVDHGGHVRRSHVPEDYQGFPRAPMGTYNAVNRPGRGGRTQPGDRGGRGGLAIWTWD